MTRRVWCTECGRYVYRIATRYWWLRHVDRKHDGWALVKARKEKP